MEAEGGDAAQGAGVDVVASAPTPSSKTSFPYSAASSQLAARRNQDHDHDTDDSEGAGAVAQLAALASAYWLKWGGGRRMERCIEPREHSREPMPLPGSLVSPPPATDGGTLALGLDQDQNHTLASAAAPVVKDWDRHSIPSPPVSVRVPVPVRIVQITDPHLGHLDHERTLRRLCEEIVRVDPDLVLLTGDFFVPDGDAGGTLDESGEGDDNGGEEGGDPDIEAARCRGNRTAFGGDRGLSAGLPPVAPGFHPDSTYPPADGKGLLRWALWPLRALHGRTFACLGNHDEESLRVHAIVRADLRAVGVQLMYDDAVAVPTRAGPVVVHGLA